MWSKMELLLFADVHRGIPNWCMQQTEQITQTDNAILKKMNKIIWETKPNIVVILGDLIIEWKWECKKNIKNIKKVKAQISNKNPETKIVIVAGNHDFRWMNTNQQKLANALDIDKLYYSFDEDNYHYIVLFSKEDEKTKKSTISKKQLKRLKKDLGNTMKECIVLVHHGMDEDHLSESFFDGNKEKWLISNRGEVIDIFEKSGKVAFVTNGHLHWIWTTTKTKGITYCTVPAVVKDFKNKSAKNIPYTLVSIIQNNDESKINVNFY